MKFFISALFAIMIGYIGKIPLCHMIIYKTTNLINGKIYIGQDSKNNPKYLGSGLYLKRVIKKYGKENFKKEILESCSSMEELNKMEIYWIDKLNSKDSKIGYNISEGGFGTTGHKHSEGTILDISKKAKRRKWMNNGSISSTIDIDEINNYLSDGWILGRLPFSDEHIKALSDSHMGQVVSEKARKLLSKKLKGRKLSEENKRKLKIASIGKYTLEWFIGKYGEIEGDIKYKEKCLKNKNISTGRITINNGKINKMIYPNEIKSYKGWIKGRIKIEKICVNNGKINKMIHIKELKNYKEWSKRRIKTGKIWSNDGNINKLIYPSELGEKWEKGRIKTWAKNNKLLSNK